MDNHENPTRPAGKVMMVLAWMVALGLLIMYFSSVEEKAYNPNTRPESQQSNTSNTVILQRNRFDHYVTKGFINQQSVVFLLDTGASDVVVPEKLAQRLKLKKGAQQLANTANGTIKVYKTQLDTLTIGTITLRNVDASINPSMNGLDILLGMSALKDIEFTQRGEQLTLKQYR